MKLFNKKDKEEFKCTKFERLVEYFYIFGIEPESINIDHFDDEESYLKKGFFSAQRLSQFPPINKPCSNINPKIIQNHCFPQGYKIVNKNFKPLEEYFSFSLDNAFNTTPQNSKIYFSCVLTFEPLDKYIEINNIIHPKIVEKVEEDDEKDDEEPKKTKTINFDNLYAPKAIVISSFMPFPNEFKNILSKLISYTKLENVKIPIEKIIENLVFGIPCPQRTNFYITSKKSAPLIPKQNEDIDFNPPEFNQYYTKSYKFQTVFNFSVDEIFEIFKSLLLELPVLFFCNKKELLTNIFESFMAMLQPFEYQNPHVAILPDVNAGIIEYSNSFAFGINQEWVDPNKKEKKPSYFQKLNLKIIDKSILICDVDNHKIKKYRTHKDYQHIINFEDLGNYSHADGVDPLTLSSKDANGDECVNNIDAYNLPEHYTKKKKKKIKDYMNRDLNSKEYDAKISKEIGESVFYYYLVSLFLGYNDYIYGSEENVKKICNELTTKELKDISVESLFNIKGFISANSGKDTSFYTKFFETNMFKHFLYRKYMNRDIDRLSILFFDETICAKKNKKWFSKKIKTEFLNFKAMKSTKAYPIKETKEFENDEYKYLEANKNKLIKYYQSINKEKFTYYIFPKLLYDNKFFKDPYEPKLCFDKDLQYNLEDYHNTLETLKTKKFNKLYQSDFAKFFLYDPKTFMHPSEMKNALYLLWLNVFCMTFYYCDEKEKPYRYGEMIDVLSNVTINREKIIPQLMATISEYGDDRAVIRFFESLNKNYTYTDYAFMCNKFISDKKIQNNLKKMNIANTRLSINYYRDSTDNSIFDIINNTGIKTLGPRTFSDEKPKEFKGNQTLEKEALIFDDEIMCENCKKNIKLEILTKSFDKMSKSSSQMTCPECQKQFNANCNVQVDGKSEKVTFWGIYYLYCFSNEIIKTYGNKVELEVLRKKYTNFFWNCLWYFGLNGLSYDMMLKYKFINYYNPLNDKKQKKIKFKVLEVQKTDQEVV